jgi:hypothetical protein
MQYQHTGILFLRSTESPPANKNEVAFVQSELSYNDTSTSFL